MKKLLVSALLIVMCACFACNSRNNGKIDISIPFGNNWTEQRREADPIGYSKFVEKSLKADLKSFEDLRVDLIKSSDELVKNLTQKRERLGSLEKIFDRCADALEADVYPVEILGATYEKAELEVQIQTLVGQMEQLKKSIGEFEELERKANEENGTLIVKLDQTRDELAKIDTNRSLFEAQKITSDTKELVEEMSRIFEGNAKFLANSSPVRTSEELIAQQEKENAKDPKAKVSSDLVEKYLNEYRTQKDTK